MRLRFIILGLIVLCATAAFARTRLPQGSIGFYSNGSLESDAQIAGLETGLLKLFPERDRGYGNPVMIEMLTSLGVAYENQFTPTQETPYERLHVGDIAQKGGGSMEPMHASHQNGLDADIIYFRADHTEHKEMDEHFVKGGKVTANFDTARNWWMLRWLYGTGRIDRIFVDKEIKRHLCKHAKELEPVDSITRGEVLRLLRPWPAHDDHMHVRLECPENNKRCVGSLPVPAGDGCDAKSLDESGFESQP